MKFLAKSAEFNSSMHPNGRQFSRVLSTLLLFTSFFSVSSAFAVDIAFDNTITEIAGDGDANTCLVGDIYRLGTTASYNGQALDILVEITAEDNEYDELNNGACITVANGVLATHLRDRDAADDAAFLDIKFTVVQQNTSIPVEVDRIVFTGFDLDTNGVTSGEYTTSTDDIYMIPPSKGYVNAGNSSVTYSEGAYGDGYALKLKGNSTGNCDDSATTPDASCRGGGIAVFGANGANRVTSVNIRVANDVAYGQTNHATAHRLIEISFQEVDFNEILNGSVDHGDIPVSYVDASHSVSVYTVLGFGYPADNENAQYSVDADADDLDPAGQDFDDEDGVKIDGNAAVGSVLEMVVGRTHDIGVTTIGTGFLSAWLDLNGDGDFLDAGEKILSDTSISSTVAINTSINVNIPSSNYTGVSYARFRFSQNAGVAPSGDGGVGEVEDYKVIFNPGGNVVGHLYEDLNGNGTQDPGEPNLGGVEVVITDSIGVQTTVQTDGNGDYRATAIRPGTVTVDINDADLPAGFIQTEGNDPTTNVTVNADVDNVEENNGFHVPNGTISGTVTEDIDGDGAGDNPISGVSLTLVDSAGNPVVDIYGNAIAAVTTGGSGNYSFTNVPPGTDYKVIETDKAGFVSVSDSEGANNNEVASISVTDGNTTSGNDFVDTQAGSITGTVQEDTNGDGTGDSPIADVSLSLVDSAGNTVIGTDGNPIIAVTTNGSGNYSFANVPPGTGYKVIETDKAGYISVGDSQGANDNEVGNIDVVSGGSSTGNDFVDEIDVLPLTTDDVDTYTPGVAKSVTILGNDTSGDTIVPATVQFTTTGTPGATLSADGKTLTVPGEGVWTVDASGVATFTPENGYTGSPTPATYTGEDAEGNTSNESTITLTALYASVNIVKSLDSIADTNGNGNTDAGDTITYRFDVSNTGDLVLNPVAVVDTKIASVTCAATSLAVGASTTCSGDYVITSADVSAGGVENVATATGTPINPDGSTGTPVTDLSDAGTTPDGTPVSNPETTETPNPLGENPNDPANPTDDPTTVALTPVPSIAIIKSLDSIADTNGNGNTNAGDTITYRFDVSNTGDLVLNPVAVVDTKIASVTCAATSLAVGASTTCSGDYVITSADVSAGGVENVATATGTPINPDGSTGTPITDLSDAGTTPDGTPVSNPETTETPNPLGENPNDPANPTDDPTTVTLTPAPAAITGTVWLDRDKDGAIDSNEERKAGWILKIVDSNGEVVSTTVTGPNGEYEVTGLIPGEYTVEFYNPDGVYITSSSTNGPVAAGQTVDLPLPVDPSGVVYDSVTRVPIEGVILELVNSQGTPVDASCLGANQQGQVTREDGLYAFDVSPSSHSSCPEGDTYTIRVVNVPTGYETTSTQIPADTRVYDSDANEANCTVDSIANSNSCEVQAQPDQPTGNQDTTYFMSFILNSGDSNIIFNHIPLDTQVVVANDVVLTKSVNKKQVSVGDQLYYTIIADNTATGNTAINIDILDNLPAGFKFTGSTAKLVVTGPDAQFDSADYAAATTVTADGAGKDPVRFGVISIPAGQKIQIGYLLKVGTGVRQGNAVNTAQAMSPGTSTPVSNEATATVVVRAESVLDDATLIGKVFHDRDGDGYQDSADVTGIKVRSGKWAKNLGNLTGRVSVLDNPAKHSKTVRVPHTGASQIKVTTKEGSVITINREGQVTESHTGLKAKGLSAQDIRVSVIQLQNATDILITNYGIQEEGIPGVRLATVKGLLIETDGYGRYHIPDVDGGRRGMGKNFILKVDKATLPEGARFTTENPRVLRLTGAALNKINFGVKLPVQASPYSNQSQPAQYRTETRKTVTTRQVPVYQSVDVNLGSIFFDKDKHNIRRDQRGVMDDIASKIQRYGRGHISIDAFTDSRHNAKYNIKLAHRRANTVRAELQKRLGSKLMRNVKVDVDKRAYNEVPHNDPHAIDFKKNYKR